MKANPSAQASFARHPDIAVMGDYPTLNDINMTYGKTFAEQWLYPHIVDLSVFSGAKNPDKWQVRRLASVIAVEYRYLKVTEVMLFFHLFKTGRYGRFYGTVDPMVITCAMRDFVKERSIFIEQYELQRNNIGREMAKRGKVSYEEWLQLKKQEEINKSENE